MHVDSVTLELTVLPVMEPKNYKGAKELMNAAHEQIRQIVCPWQTGEATKAVFSDQPEIPKPAAP